MGNQRFQLSQPEFSRPGSRPGPEAPDRYSAHALANRSSTGRDGTRRQQHAEDQGDRPSRQLLPSALRVGRPALSVYRGHDRIGRRGTLGGTGRAECPRFYRIYKGRGRPDTTSEWTSQLALYGTIRGGSLSGPGTPAGNRSSSRPRRLP